MDKSGQLQLDQPAIPYARLDFVRGMLDTWFVADVGRPPKKAERTHLQAIAEAALTEYIVYIESKKEA